MLPVYLVILTFGVLVISAPTDKMETASGARTATETTVMNEPITDASWSSLTKSTDDDSGANCPSLSGSDILIAAALGLVFGIAALSCLYLVKNRIGACTNSIYFDGSSDFNRRSNSEVPRGQNIIYASVNVKPARTQRDTSGDGEDSNEDSPGDSVSTRGQFGEEQEKVLGRQDIVHAWLIAKPKRRQSESSEADGEIH